MAMVSTDEPNATRTDGAADPHLPRSSTHDVQREGDDPVRCPGKFPRTLLDEHALTVVRRLKRFGHEAYLVGGCVRDLLSGLEPKDFDVVTDARPNRIKRVFRNAWIIGRRFRLAHIRFGPDKVIETSTYRADPALLDADAAESSENIFGTAPEDARRRDFTINALFYDPVEDEILDWVDGLRDLEAGVVRSIGNPVRRIQEDPVRMIRAAHFAERMGFALEPELDAAMRSEAACLAEASPARLYLELIKVLGRAKARPTLHRLHEMGVLQHWLPELNPQLEVPATWPEAGGGTHEEARHGEPEGLPTAHATWNLLGAADHWGMGAHGADDALALAPLLGPWLLQASILPGRHPSFHHYADRFDATLRPMALRMSIPRRTAARLRDLLWLWREMRHSPQGRKAQRIIRRPVFPLALAYLRLDLMARDCPLDVLDAWEKIAPPPRPEGEEAPEPGRGRGRGRGRGGRGDRRRGRRQRPEVRTEEDAWAPAPEPDTEAPPVRRAKPKPTAQPKPAPKPKPVAKPKPAPQAEPKAKPRSTPEPAPRAKPTPVDDDFAAGLE